MDAAQFQRVAELFSRARPLPLCERDEFLDAACAGDTNLRAGVGALLLGAERTLPFASLAVDLGSAATPMTIEEGGGGDSRIGPYKLLEKIGEGGFGTVYMAEQIEPVRRKVALKVLRPGYDTRQVVARFEAERQALAMMDHANITRVLDGGATGSGRPYFVMELIRGVPITQFCDHHKLSARERIELFIPVCQAVQHAHHKGIIHRDLKPSNVLVTLHDGVPTPKVIDFGIAKALHQPLTDKTLFTEFRQLMGTPEYMSPEQAEMSGMDIDTRTDVYSLGVMLYELLVGTTPFDGGTLRSADYGEMQRILRDVDPPTPSRRLSAMTTPPGATPVPPTAGAAAPSAPRTAQDVARARGSDPHALRRQLRGDLDWIVMKCLDKDRRRRYESASDLAADLTRYLRQQAVLASPPSTIYRLRKLSRRHRVAVLAAGAVLLSLVLGLCGTVWGWQVARTQRDEAMASHARAERQLRENIALASVMRMTVHLISAHGQAPSYGVKQLVADLHEAMEERLRGQPEAYVRARLALALVYEETGEHDKLNGQVDLALTRARASLTQDDPALADAVQLAAFARYEAGRVVEAEQLAHEALALRARVPGTAHLALAVLAKGALVRGRFAAARKFARAGMDEARRSCGADTAEESGLLQILAGISLAEGYDTCVEPMLAQLLAQRCAQFGARHPFVGVIHVLQARAALLREDTAAAEQNVQAAEELTRSDPSVYRIQDIRCTSLRADIARARGDFAAELPLRRQACARLAATNGRTSNEYARAAFQLAEALVDIGSPDEAVALCRDTLSVAPDVGGDLTLAQLYLRCALGCALHARGALAEAQAELEAALVVARAQLGATHVATATVQAALAELALAAANPDLARRMAEAAASTFALHPRPRLRLAQAQALAALASAPGDEHALRAAAGELRRHQGARKSLRQRVERALAQARD